MPTHYSKARKRWVFEFDRVVDGRRHRACKLLPREWGREEAEAYARQQEGKLYAVAAGVRQDWLISDAVLAYLTEHGSQLKNPAKLEADIKLSFPWFSGRRIDELPDVVAQYRKDNADLAPATIKNRMSYLRAACRWAWKHKGMGQSDPGAKVAMPRVSNERQVYTDRAGALKIARAIPHPDARAVVLVAYYSGMRLGEILRAKPRDGVWVLDDTKNGSPRMVPIHPRTAHLARRWPRAVAASTVQHNFRAAADRMGFTGLRLHDLRHSTASALIAAGVDLYTVGGVLGHKSAASTKRYSHLSVDALRRAIGSL